MRVKLGGRHYTVLFRAPPGAPASDGMVSGNKIYIRRGMSRKRLFQTLLHEALHAEMPFLDEDAVTAAENRISNFILRALETHDRMDEDA